MGIITARRVITLMTRKKSRQKWSVSQFIRQPVRQNRLIFTIYPIIETTIAFLISIAYPWPTMTQSFMTSAYLSQACVLVDFFPKTLCDRLFRITIIAWQSAISTSIHTDLRSSPRDQFSTIVAGKGYAVFSSIIETLFRTISTTFIERAMSIKSKWFFAKITDCRNSIRRLTASARTIFSTPRRNARIDFMKFKFAIQARNSRHDNPLDDCEILGCSVRQLAQGSQLVGSDPSRTL